MKNQSTRARLLASSMICGAAIAAGGQAMAQAQDQGTNVQEIVVTGSRIPSANLTSASPISTVTSQDVKLQGTSNVEDLINTLPQAFGDFGNYESNGASGTATIDLRGIGNKRTLVLVDGTRLQAGDPTSDAVAADIDIIPPALIDRLEVLTGGASAVYGSDAIAGVVNFIMKKNFQGLQIDEQTSVAEDGGGNQQVRAANQNGVTGAALGLTTPSISFPGGTWDGIRQTVTITGGVNSPDDKGNVEFYLGYTYIQAVDEGQRDYTKCSLATNTGDYVQWCGGSSTDATGRLVPESGPNKGGNSGFGYNILGTPSGGILPAFDYGQVFNYAPYNYLQRPDQRYTAGEFSHYEIAPWMTLYSSFMFMDDHSTAAVAPSGSFFGDRVFTIPCNDPLLSSAQASTLCGPGPYAPGQDGAAAIGRRDVEGGPRTADFDHIDYRMQFGSKGDLGDGWSYDLMGLYGRSILTEEQGGYFQYSKLENALNVVTDTRANSPTFGQPVCASVIAGTDTACVPYNLWSPGGVTQKSISYLEGLAENSGYTQETIVSLSFSNPDLSKYGLKLPWANDGFGVNLGAEYRGEQLATFYDAAIESGDLAGFGGSLANTSGSQINEDLFGELRMPLVQDMPGFKDLTLDAGYRFSDYSHGGGNNTYRVEGTWQVISDIKLRASYERAARAPNVEELFEPTTPGLFAGSDPCAGASPKYSAAQCYNTIAHTDPTMTEAYFAANVYGKIPQCVAGQCGDTTGGNPDLKPEQADTYSVGFVLTPSFFRNFTLSADYWSIKVHKAIISLFGEVAVTNCAVLNNPLDCSLISRDAALGYPIYGGLGAGAVSLPLINASEYDTSGIDVSSSYRQNLEDWGLKGMGSLNFNFNGTYTRHLLTVLPDGTSFDCIGLYGVTCTIPTPRWRHVARLTWNTPWNVDFSVNWRFIGHSSLDFNTNQPDLQDGAFKDTLPTDAHIPDYSYFDLALTWRVKDGWQLRAGVNNVFDKTPPLLDANSFGISAPPFGNGNTYPQVYDPLGRVMFVGVTADF